MGSANALTVNSNPLAIAVPFTCKYPVDVKISSKEFNLKDVVLGAGPSNEGNLATGFDLTLDAGVDDPIKLGERQEVKATWKVTALKDVFFNFTGCTVTQDDTEVALVKNYCFAKALKVTPAEGSATVQAFSYQTFSSVGATSKFVWTTTTCQKKTQNASKRMKPILVPTTSPSLVSVLAEMKNKVAEMTHKVAEMTHKGAEMTHKVAEMTYKVAEMTHKVAELTHKVAEMTHKVAEMTHKVAEMGRLGRAPTLSHSFSWITTA